MRKETAQVTIGCLLHNVSELFQRSSDEPRNVISDCGWLEKYTQDIEILRCANLHSNIDIDSIPSDSIAYIATIADKIASGGDGGEADRDRCSDKPTLPLNSVFNLLNGNALDYWYPVKPLDNLATYPMVRSEMQSTKEQYNRIVHEIERNLDSIEVTESYISPLISILENCLSFVPIKTKEPSDISMFDYAKITAAVGASICEFVYDRGITDIKSELYDKDEQFFDKQAFLMVSCDFSGIQPFIYNIIKDGALKSLRSRSFTLQLLMAHCIDEILDGCGVSRANLLYSGGGHCYLLLPNTAKSVEFLEDFKRVMAAWLRKQFGTGLYLSAAWQPCSANDLMNKPQYKSPYKKIFSNLDSALSEQTYSRYSADELRELNSAGNLHGEKDCKICGMSYRLRENDLCDWCGWFKNISEVLLVDELVIITANHRITELLSTAFPSTNGDVWLHFTDRKRAEQLSKADGIIRLYSKNTAYTELAKCSRIFLGTYCSNTLLNELVKDTQGIERVGVYRADVDNLGLSFISGFERDNDDPAERYRYVTLTRSAAFSRMISLFFQYYINSILAGEDIHSRRRLSSSLTEDKGSRIIIVYSGGDDIFLIGHWSDVIDAAMDIREAFQAYTANTLTLSGGIGIYSVKYPVAKEASETAKLERLSKEQPNKNAISLFTADGENTYSWPTFTNRVIGEKLAVLRNFFELGEIDQERGNAFLYRLLSFLQAADKRINIARYAYLLARLEPKRASQVVQKSYRAFSQKMYQWIQDIEDRRELITAIYIFFYLTRKRKDEK